jgi:protein-tyrosine phosphatase
MFDFLFPRKNAEKLLPLYPVFEAIEVDIHAHLIPNVDDGAPDLATSVQLIREMMDLGFKQIIATPHISELYPNDKTLIFNGLAELNKQLRSENINVDVTAAAEYMINDVFEQKLISDEPLLTLPNKHILVELSHISEPVNLYKVIGLLVQKDYVPILAHPERYRYYDNKLVHFQKLIDHGCRLQVNALSLEGYYGRVVSDCAWALLNHRMIEFIGSDIHHMRHVDILKNGVSTKTQHIINTYPFQNKLFAQKGYSSRKNRQNTEGVAF